MAERVATHPIGIGEPLFFQDAERRFRNFRQVVMTVTPDVAWNALGHLEMSGWRTPGYGPVLAGLAVSGVPAGTPEANQIYATASQAAAQRGAEWEYDDSLDPWEKVRRSSEEVARRNAEIGLEGAVSYGPGDLAADPSLADPYRPAEEAVTAFGILKGVSRWGMLILDMIPEGLDALGRAVSAVKTDQLSVPEAAGGLIGIGEAPSQTVGIPLFQYLGAALEGERLNMGTGLFAQGEVANDIQWQLGMYDSETDSRIKYNEEREQGNGTVLVPGLNGMTYRANNFEEWQFLRNNAGRAALLQQIQATSPQQAALGQAFGTFNEDVFDEAAIARAGNTGIEREKTGQYYSHSVGRTFASLFTDPDTVPFHAVSASADFGKQLLDLNLIGLVGKGGRMLARGGKFIGLGDEGGRMVRASAAMNKIDEAADLGAHPGMANDFARGTVNVDMASNAIARGADTALKSSIETVHNVQRHAPPILRARRAEAVADLIHQGIDPKVADNMVSRVRTSAEIDALIRRAQNGDIPAGTWMSRILSDIPGAGDELDRLGRLQTFHDVSARAGVDIVGGKFGLADVGDDVAAAARREAEDLADVLGTGKGSVIRNAEGAFEFTFDADLGKAQATLGKLQEVAPTGGGFRTQLVGRLFNEDVAVSTWARKALGDNDAAADEVDNLIRVLRRNDDALDLYTSISDFKPIIEPSRLNEMLTGGGAMDDLTTSLADADTYSKVFAIISPAVEFGGRSSVPRGVVKAFKNASTKGEVAEVFMSLGTGVKISPQRIGLLGKQAKFAAATTGIGALTGGTLGGIQGAEQGEGFGDILGGAVTGTLVGSAIGSGIGGFGGALTRGATRSIDDIADSMDLMMAGYRSATTDILRARGFDMGRAAAGLGIPQQLGYAYGHSSLGRRIARHHKATANLADPDDLFYTVTDLARSFGMNVDLVDDVLDTIADMAPNNLADGHRALKEFGKVADEALEAQGVPEVYRGVLTKYFTDAEKEFIGNVNSIGNVFNPAQSMVLNGEILNAEKGAMLSSELWSGTIHLPSPEQVQRAMMQADRLGRIQGVFTGKGVWFGDESVWKALAGKLGDEQVSGMRQALTPQLARNVAIRSMRGVTAGLWAPMVLLTRPMSFLSRVLGEDQARMMFSSLDNLFTHPIHYFHALLANFDTFRNMGAMRGVAARSLIPDTGIFDESGKLIDDAFDNMNEWELAARQKDALGIYDRGAAKAARNYGTQAYGRIKRGAQNFLASVADEYRQLLFDPMIHRLSVATTNNPVDEVTDWLLNTKEGRRVLDNWARQFKTPAQARRYMEPDALRGFVEDQYARMHLKTGGDWVFVVDRNGTKAVLNSNGDVVNPTKAAEEGWDQYNAGYTIIREGDEALMRPLRSREIGGHRIARSTVAERGSAEEMLNKEIHEAIHDEVKAANTRFENLADRGIAGNRFPEQVKGTYTTDARADLAGIKGKWDEALDYMYDLLLGAGTRVFSRQPVLGNFFWERVGMMLPSMDDEVAKAFRALAKKEGALRQIDDIADAVRVGNPAKGVLDDFNIAVLDAQAYAVERTKDTLFDLTRQRNVIDGLRIVAPFAGPMVEAFEAWARVIKERPVQVWRRGGQLVDHLWDTSPIAQPQPKGMFWTDEDGTEMISVPFTDMAMKARGLNVVFGPDDMRAEPNAVPGPNRVPNPDLEDLQTFAGAPLAAINPGVGPVITFAVSPLLKDSEGVAGEINEWLFPYGQPDTGWNVFMPYHLLKAAEGQLGEASQRAKMATSAEQLELMFANGLVGEGLGYEYNLELPGAMDRAWAEAWERGTRANWVESLARGLLPSMVTPELMVNIDALRAEGMETDMVISMQALADHARELFSEDGAKMLTTEDGHQVSTEGDWEVVTDYMNRFYGKDMYSADFLSIPTSQTVYLRSFTETGHAWTRDRTTLLTDLKGSGALIMPDYANVRNTEDYDFDARAAAIERGDIDFYEPEEIPGVLEAKMLAMRNRAIDLQADRRFGHDDDITESTEIKDAKKQWKWMMKQQAAGQFARASFPVGVNQKAFDELKNWDQVNWEKYDLTPEEQETVDGVLWYLAVRDQANTFAQQSGLTSLTHKGSSDDDKEIATIIRNDVMRIVEQRISQNLEGGFPMGNFVYLWERYFWPELNKIEEPDPLAELARARNLNVEPELEGATP